MLPPDPRQMSVNKLVGHIAGQFTPSTSDLALQALLDEADLHPTQQTAYLMAQSAVMTLLAHDLGVKVTGPLKTVEHVAAPAQLPPAPPETPPPRCAAPDSHRPQGRRGKSQRRRGEDAAGAEPPPQAGPAAEAPDGQSVQMPGPGLPGDVQDLRLDESPHREEPPPAGDAGAPVAVHPAINLARARRFAAAAAEPEEIDLPPTEVANPAGGEMLGRATLPFARAVDHPVKHPATYTQTRIVDGEPAEPAPVRYCKKCYIALPTAARDKCTNCGAPLRKT